MYVTKRYLFGLFLGFVSLVLLSPPAHAGYSQDFTISAINNAGQAYNQAHYARLTGTGDPSGLIPLTTNVDASTTAAFTGWTTGAHSVLTYTQTVPNVIYNWTMTSAGDIWNASSHSHIYQSTGLLTGGTYRVSVLPTTDAFTYDYWNWSSSTIYGHYGWFLQIADNHGHNYALGAGDNTTHYAATMTNKAALIAYVSTLYLDLTVTPGTELYFWIYDVNTLDNNGALSFRVSNVPLPSSLLLALGGLPALALFRIRRYFRC